MALWNEGRHRGRMNLDDMARSGDSTLNILVVVLLVAFALVAWYSYGSMGPAVDQATPPPAKTQSAPEPYPVTPVPPAPDATAAKPAPQRSPSPSP